MSNDNGSKPRIDIINEKIKELEVNKDANKVELTKLYEEKISLELPKKEEPKDFKIAEIWIREGQLMLDASPEFWMDKLRALGVLEMCKDIVKKFKQEKPKIITGNMMNKFNRIKNRVGGMFGKK
ncbi:hypothetical protein LCGC14_1242330 [marine sediment metagenome]|uniref:Uncharacterized protein n=1 Tax=marine sediment metagenome TaxID=412755 RepID=A0A0F9P9K4_9ZZZZ|nr:hypothetical protein [Candidatus Aminicenantes bacterium]